MPRIYSDEFKRDAVALVESGIALKQVANDLGSFQIGFAVVGA